jgi:hypothetical protein
MPYVAIQFMIRRAPMTAVVTGAERQPLDEVWQLA